MADDLPDARLFVGQIHENRPPVFPYEERKRDIVVKHSIKKLESLGYKVIVEAVA